MKGAASGGSFGTGVLSGGEPLLKGGLAFPRWFAGQEAIDADVLVEPVPMDAASPPDQPPAFPFRLCRMYEAREPIERHGEASPIAEFHGQRVVRDGD